METTTSAAAGENGTTRNGDATADATRVNAAADESKGETTIVAGAENASGAKANAAAGEIGTTEANRGGRTRTCNPRFWRPVLCQLSYAPGLRSDCTRGFCGQ